MCHPPTNGTHRRTIRNGSIAVAGTQVGSTHSVFTCAHIVGGQAHRQNGSALLRYHRCEYTSRCRTIRNGSIAVAGTQVGSTPSVSREVFLSHTGRCSVQFSSARGGGLSADRDKTVDAGGRRRRPPPRSARRPQAAASRQRGERQRGGRHRGKRQRGERRPQAAAGGRSCIFLCTKYFSVYERDV